MSHKVSRAGKSMPPPHTRFLVQLESGHLAQGVRGDSDLMKHDWNAGRKKPSAVGDEEARRRRLLA